MKFSTSEIIQMYSTNLPASIVIPILIHHGIDVLVLNAFARLFLNIAYLCVELYVKPQLLLIVPKVIEENVGGREHLAGVAGHAQLFHVAKEGVPVVAHVELLVRLPRPPLVNADQLPVPGIQCIKTTCKIHNKISFIFRTITILSLSPQNKLSLSKLLVCFNFQSALTPLKIGAQSCLSVKQLGSG